MVALSAICILNENGKLVKSITVRGPWGKVVDEIKRLAQPLAICYEASCGYGHLYDRLRPMAKRLVVAQPGQLRLIFRSKKKSDRVDARTLATLLYLDQVPRCMCHRWTCGVGAA